MAPENGVGFCFSDGDHRVLPQKGRGTTGARDSAFGLPTDVVNQSAVRLRVLALVYAFVFVMAGYVPAFLLPGERARLFSTPLFWGPGAIAIGVALLVAALVRSARVPPSAAMNIGLIFETRSRLTVENAIHGTPAFIAPEQALGGSTIDGRADIYATGCVAYWLLTGQLVFTADTPLGLVMHHLHSVPTPPSVRTELRIPAVLDQLVMSCLAKDPADRPQTAKELSHRLAAIEGQNRWTEDNARAWWAAHHPALAERAQA